MSEQGVPSFFRRMKSTPQVSMPIMDGILPISLHFAMPASTLFASAAWSQQSCPSLRIWELSKRKISSRTIFPFST